MEGKGRTKSYIYVQGGGGPKASIEFLMYFIERPHMVTLIHFFPIFSSNILPEAIRKNLSRFFSYKTFTTWEATKKINSSISIFQGFFPKITFFWTALKDCFYVILIVIFFSISTEKKYLTLQTIYTFSFCVSK